MEYYIMGHAFLGKRLEKFFQEKQLGNFLGFLDNKAVGENIYKPETIENKSAKVFVASINYMYEMFYQLKNLGFDNVVTFPELTLQYPELQSFNQAFLKVQDDYVQHQEKYEYLRNILADDKSREVLDALIKFRKTFDIDCYANVADDIENQYFEEFMPKDLDVFIDGGGFDGDTVQRAFRHMTPKKIYFFEPDDVSLNKAKENLKNIKEIEYFPYGLSDKEKVLKFDSRGELGSCFSDSGNVEIKCVSLDETVKEDKAFIKLDIEGAEADALNGAKRLIRNGSPLAVCVYHKPEDIWKIPELLINITGIAESLDSVERESLSCLDIIQTPSLKQSYMLNLKYKFFLRHYTTCVFDTILYAIPECS